MLDKLKKDQLLKKDCDPWTWRYIAHVSVDIKKVTTYSLVGVFLLYLHDSLFTLFVHIIPSKLNLIAVFIFPDISFQMHVFRL